MTYNKRDAVATSFGLPGALKVALVTGGSSGIGLVSTLGLLGVGYHVWVAARRVEKMAPLEDAGAKVVRLDLCDSSSITQCMDKLLAEEGRIDLLVNNAGFGQAGSVEEVPLEDARRQFEVNVFGLARLCQLALPVMRAQGEGRIVNVSSMAGRFSSPFLGWYHASKYAVEALSDALRIETEPFGIKVSLVEPGFIKTDWGTIAAKSLRDVSCAGDYKEAADKVASVYESVYSPKSRGSSGVQPVFRAILKAATSRHPKSRYVVGKRAHLFIAGRRLLGDSAFDELERWFFGF